ncbi:MAG: hypothetical protein ACREMG_01550, partial [Gemmatimonadales bacterium]
MKLSVAPGRAPGQLSAGKAVGRLVLFLLPFAAVGIGTGAMAVRAVLARDWGQAGFLAIFALTFSGIGIGGMVAALMGRGKLAEQESLEARNPDQPWLWRADWAAGRIDDSNRKTRVGAWLFTTFWNLVSIPGAVVGVRESVEKGNHVGLIALLFPVIGIGLLTWAIRNTARHRKFGVSRFELATRPGVIGHALAGTVRTSVTLLPPEGFKLTLSGIRRVTSGSRDDRSTTETVLFQDERRVRGDGRSIPVVFPLPADVQPSDQSNSNNTVLWRLEVEAAVPGIDYASSFEVPVFRTADSEKPRTAGEEAALKDPQAPAVYQQPAESPITVTSTLRGTEIFFPAARNPGAALGLTAFLLIWSGGIWASIHFGAPMIFPIVFGLFWVLLFFGALELWLGVSRVTADRDGVTIATGYLAPLRERIVSAPEIGEVTTRIGMQSGRTPYYDVILVRKIGRPVTVARGVRD